VLAPFEALAAHRANITLVVNERERAALRRLAPDANVHVLPNGIDLETFKPRNPPTEDATIVFTGVMSYQPNADAALWLVSTIWPSVRARRPDARLWLVGSDPPGSLRQLAGRDPTITVTGTVDDVRAYLWHSAVAVAPLRVSHGLQNKVLEAIAAGLPAVVTPAVAEGLPHEALPACMISSTPDAFTDAIVHLLARGGDERRAIAGSANLRLLSWRRCLAPLANALQETAAQGCRTARVPLVYA
jgi:glycosyltransferase involved in cell wall biosynthesis